MEIAITNLQKKILLNPPRIKRVIQHILLQESIMSASLSFVFVSRQRIRALNKKFLREDHATDVLAFDLRDETPFVEPKKRCFMTALCGEIIISTDAALQYARGNNVSLKQELVLYMIHGILHLLGYDDHQSDDIKKMRRKEQELLSLLGKRVDGVIAVAGKTRL